MSSCKSLRSTDDDDVNVETLSVPMFQSSDGNIWHHVVGVTVASNTRSGSVCPFKQEIRFDLVIKLSYASEFSFYETGRNVFRLLLLLVLFSLHLVFAGNGTMIFDAAILQVSNK